jgi:hypothetical protein
MRQSADGLDASVLAQTGRFNSEPQKKRATIAGQAAKIASLEHHLDEIHAPLVKLESRDELVALR